MKGELVILIDQAPFQNLQTVTAIDAFRHIPSNSNHGQLRD